MSEQTTTADDILNNLTPEEMKILARAIKQVECSLFDSVAKRIRNWVVGAIAALTCFGIMTFSGIKAAIVDEASRRLADDSRTTQQLVERVSHDIESTTGMLAKAELLSNKLDTEAARGAATIAEELRQIHRMIDQIRGEIESGNTHLEGPRDGNVKETEQ